MTMTATLPRPERPYKFLDFYTEADAPVFFGRRHEIEILLADIIATRLVVLFARTGTGKSSLIHAGIRPRLHALDYRTVLARTGIDPSASILEAVRRAELLPDDAAERPLAEALMAVVKQETRPIVVFVDQFEEFFLSSIAPDLRKRFLREVGELYRTPRSGVHLVFSLREDYLAEMDVFRDEIPTIFQKESQLRLRPFTPEQAREAVEGPSKTFEPAFRYQQGLVEKIVADLPREGESILPVSVQIVCDTLWRKREPNGTIPRKLYETLGSAAGILAARVIEDLRELDAPSLLALETLIPHLSTPDWTKQPRTLSELQTLTAVDAKRLDAVVRKLEELHLFRVDARESEQIAEWVSDYVSALSKDLIPTLRLMWVRKIPRRQGIPPDRLAAILNERAITSRFDGADWYHLLHPSSRSRDTLGLWFTRASSAGQDPWNMLRGILDDPALPAEDVNRVLLYLGEFEEDVAVDILARQVQRKDRARTALRALGATRSKRALEFLRPALDDPELHGTALDALQSLGQKDALELAEKARKQSRSWREVLFGSKARTLTGLSGDGWVEVVACLRRSPTVVLIGPHIGTARAAMAEALARDYGYPFQDRQDLDAVLDFLTVELGAGWKKALAGFSESLTDTDDRDYAALARIPALAYVTSDPTSQLLRQLTRQYGRTFVTTPLYGVQTTPTISPDSPLVMFARGLIQSPETLEQLDYRFVAAFVRGQLSHADFSADHLNFIVAGFDHGDRSPELFRRSVVVPTSAPIPDTEAMVIIEPPVGVESRETEQRVRRYYLTRAEREHLFFYWGKIEDFVEELLINLQEPR